MFHNITQQTFQGQLLFSCEFTLLNMAGPTLKKPSILYGDGEDSNETPGEEISGPKKSYRVQRMKNWSAMHTTKLSNLEVFI
jgi:hypothetical protein